VQGSGGAAYKAEMLITAPPFTFDQSQSYQLIHEKQLSFTRASLLPD
jgi:hypothetical protein